MAHIDVHSEGGKARIADYLGAASEAEIADFIRQEIVDVVCCGRSFHVDCDDIRKTGDGYVCATCDDSEGSEGDYDPNAEHRLTARDLGVGGYL